MISYAHLNSKEVFCANLVWLLHLAGYQKNWTWFLVLSVAVWFADWNLYNIKANFLQPLSVLKISFFLTQAYFRQYVMDTLESWYWPHLGCSGSPFINSMTGAELIKFFSLVFKSYVNNKIYLHVVVSYKHILYTGSSYKIEQYFVCYSFLFYLQIKLGTCTGYIFNKCVNYVNKNLWCDLKHTSNISQRIFIKESYCKFFKTSFQSLINKTFSRYTK